MLARKFPRSKSTRWARLLLSFTRGLSSASRIPSAANAFPRVARLITRLPRGAVSRLPPINVAFLFLCVYTWAWACRRAPLRYLTSLSFLLRSAFLSLLFLHSCMHGHLITSLPWILYLTSRLYQYHTLILLLLGYPLDSNIANLRFSFSFSLNTLKRFIQFFSFLCEWYLNSRLLYAFQLTRQLTLFIELFEFLTINQLVKL
jgi:hypothetical protein